MTTWHRIDRRGIAVSFTARPNGQGNFVLTPQELEGLMRTGGWSLDKPEPPSFFSIPAGFQPLRPVRQALLDAAAVTDPRVHIKETR